MVRKVSVFKAIDGSLHESREGAEKADFNLFLQSIFHAARILPSDDLLECLWLNRFKFVEVTLEKQPE